MIRKHNLPGTSLIVVLILLFNSFVSSAKNNGDKSPLNNYSIESAGRPASQGSYLVKVTVNTKNKNLPDKEISKCAVHGVIFRGFAGDNHHSEKPLARSASAEEEHKEFFESFFNSKAATYASPVQSTRQVSKSGKEYVISEIVEVRKDNLKNDLKEAGVIRTLTSGF